MPILRREIEVFPENLFDLPTADAPWEIAQVRSRREKSVARVLREAAKPYYLPQVDHQTKSFRRALVSHLPLFPGYIFMRRVNGLREALWRTHAVAHIMEVDDQAKLTDELLQIRRLQLTGALLAPHEEVVAGDAVRVTGGVFSGYSGIVLEERGLLRLVVSVSILRRHVVVEFPREVLGRASAEEILRRAKTDEVRGRAKLDERGVDRQRS